MADITSLWMQFVSDWVLFAPSYSYAQERKFMEGQTMLFPDFVWREGCSHNLEDLGYSKTGTKMTQLTRDYMNWGEIEAAKKAFWERKDQSVTSWAISTIGAAKRNAQGHCIRNMFVNYHHPKVSVGEEGTLVVHLHYRTTELLRKFGADLVFIRNVLIPEVLAGNPWKDEPDEVYIHFANCFFSALFIPVFYQYKDPIKFLKDLREAQGDTIFYRRCLYRTKTMLEKEPDTYKFASRRNMSEFAHRLISSGKIDKQEVQDFIKRSETKYANLSGLQRSLVRDKKRSRRDGN